MDKEDLVIRVAGESGDGSSATGEMLAQASARSGLHVFTFRTTPAEIKGGPVMFQVRASNEPVRSMGDYVDVLVAFNREAWDLHHADMARDGVLVYDPDEFELPLEFGGVAYPAPFTRLAREIGNTRGKNVAALGLVAALFGIGADQLEAIVRSKLGKKTDLLESNLQALNAGTSYVRDQLTKRDPFYMKSNATRRQMVMTGNQAIVAGALQAGIGFFAGYPITPASDIMEGLAPILPAIGGAYLQAEDEIASIMACVGASFAGKRAMTATSGPGLSLMIEALGLASMIETPVVIIDAQRGGPSTGLPTKMEQSDLNLAVYGGHGDAPRIVLAPASVAECFNLTVAAFNLAERYQSPVIVLSDYSLSFRTETIAPIDPAKYPREERLRVAEPIEPGSFHRYAQTPSGISPVSIPGMPHGQYIASGLEHDQDGGPAYGERNHELMTEKRWHKYDSLRHSWEYVQRFGAANPKIGILCWGTTAGPARGAVYLAGKQGLPVALLQVQMLSPLPEDAIQAFIDECETILVPEVNYQAQFAHLIQGTFGCKVQRMTQYRGMPFKRHQILNRVIELLGLAVQHDHLVEV